MKNLLIITLIFFSTNLATAQSAYDIEGAWMGYYDCGQGRTGVRLIINEVRNNTFSGFFQFFPHYSNYAEHVGIGVAKVSGEFYSKDSIKINLTEWVYNPYEYGLVNIQASMSGSRSLKGKMLDSSCGAFYVEKVLTENILEQCSLTFEEIYNSANDSLSSFDAFALSKGYKYDSKIGSYLCETASKTGFERQLVREQGKNGYNVIRNIFFSEESFLDYGVYLESKGSLIEKESQYNELVKSNTLILTYVFNNTVVQLKKTPFLETITMYEILVTNERLK